MTSSLLAQTPYPHTVHTVQMATFTLLFHFSAHHLLQHLPASTAQYLKRMHTITAVAAASLVTFVHRVLCVASGTSSAIVESSFKRECEQLL